MGIPSVSLAVEAVLEHDHRLELHHGLHQQTVHDEEEAVRRWIVLAVVHTCVVVTVAVVLVVEEHKLESQIP